MIQKKKIKKELIRTEKNAKLEIIKKRNEVKAELLRKTTEIKEELLRKEKMANVGLECCVCWETINFATIFIPCNHIGTCLSCTKLINECPVCRTTINDKQRVYFI